jgi:archaellum biogenesis ATPase FlaH
MDTRGFLSEILSLARPDAVIVQSGGKIISVQTANGDQSEFLAEHLRGEKRIGIYPHLSNDVCRIAVLDFDNHNGDDGHGKLNESLSHSLQTALSRLGFIVFRESSKTPGGFHLWLCFDKSVSVKKVRRFLQAILKNYEQDTGESMESIEIFPKADNINGGLGNAVFLPYFPPDEKDERTVFIDREGARISPTITYNSENTLNAALQRIEEETPREATETTGESLFSPCEQGNRNKQLCKIVGHLKIKGINKTEIENIVVLWNEKNDPPLPEREVMAALNSLFKNYDEPQKDNFHFEIQTGNTMREEIIAEASDLIPGLVRSSSLVFLGGEEGSGKSMLCMNLGIAVATGGDKFLSWQLSNCGSVIYLNAELYNNEFIYRFQRMTVTTPGKESLARFITPVHVPLLSECQPALEELIAEHQAKLVILDCLYWLSDVSEIDNDQVKKFMRALTSIRDRFNLCVLVVHHIRKGGKEQRADSHMLRGAGAISAAADTILLLRRSAEDKTLRLLTPTKIRHGRDDELGTRGLRLDPETLVFSDIGLIDEGLHLASPAGTTRVSIADIFGDERQLTTSQVIESFKEFGKSSATANRWLKDQAAIGTLKQVSRGMYEKTK